MRNIEEPERVFGHRQPRTLWVLGTKTISILEKTHIERTAIEETDDGNIVYINVTNQFKRPQDFFEDLKRNGNFMVKIPIPITKRVNLISLKSRFFIFHRNYLNVMNNEEIPQIIIINNRALKSGYIYCELIPESIQFVSDTDEVFNEKMRASSFEEVTIIKKKYTQSMFL